MIKTTIEKAMRIRRAAPYLLGMIRFGTWAVMVAALAAGTLVLITLVRPAEAAFPGANGKIVYASTLMSHPGVNNPTGDDEIFTMNPDGTGITQLTDNTTFDFSPSFSADGDVVVFGSDRDGDWDIYIMDSDGANQFRLTDNTTYEDNPTISPDRTRVAYESLRGGNLEIIVRFGGVETNLTNNAASDASPAFSRREQDSVHEQSSGQLRGLRDGRRRHGPDPPHQQRR